MNWDDGKQISPCILSKVKYALGITNRKPKNNKKCSINYWNMLVENLGKYYRIDKQEIQSVKNMTQLLR